MKSVVNRQAHQAVNGARLNSSVNLGEPSALAVSFLYDPYELPFTSDLYPLTSQKEICYDAD